MRCVARRGMSVIAISLSHCLPLPPLVRSAGVVAHPASSRAAAAARMGWSGQSTQAAAYWVELQGRTPGRGDRQTGLWPSERGEHLLRGQGSSELGTGQSGGRDHSDELGGQFRPRRVHLRPVQFGTAQAAGASWPYQRPPTTAVPSCA